MLAPIITLRNLRPIITAKGTSPNAVFRAIGIPELSLDRMSELVSRDVRVASEPWLWEAYFIARVLGVSDICTLIGEELHAIDTTDDIRGDLNIWRTGCALPLSHAVRLTRLFGLSDPYALYEVIQLRATSPVVVETWATTMSGERLGGSACPWCLADAGGVHLDTCVPNNLWGPRSADLLTIGGIAPVPRKGGKQVYGVSRKAPGLVRLRKRERLSQKEMAGIMGYKDQSYYSRIERLDNNLTQAKADILQQKYGVSWADLVMEPTPGSALSDEVLGFTPDGGTGTRKFVDRFGNELDPALFEPAPPPVVLEHMPAPVPLVVPVEGDPNA